MKSIVFILIAFLFAQASTAQPGTRKLKVVKEEGLSIYLEPRKCECKKTEPDEKGRLILCDCWCDFEKEDQPAVVGKIACVLRYARTFGADLLEPFLCGQSDEGQIYVRIPAPGLGIKRFLDFFGASEHFQILKPSETIDAVAFLKIVAQGKWVIADKDEQAEETRVYQMYLHDLNNHLFLWWLLPRELRNLMVERVQALVQLFDELNHRLSGTPCAADYIQMLNFLGASMIDVKMGSLNIKALHFTREVNITINDLESLLNVCVEVECERKPGVFYTLELLPKAFALVWFSKYQKWILNNFKKLFEFGEFEGKAQFLNDKATKIAFDALKQVEYNKIGCVNDAISLVIKEISEHEGVPEKLILCERCLEEEFSNPIEYQLKEALKLQNNDTLHGQNVRALLANPDIPAENANVIANVLLDDLMRLDGSGI